MPKDETRGRGWHGREALDRRVGAAGIVARSRLVLACGDHDFMNNGEKDTLIQALKSNFTNPDYSAKLAS
jgi:hypothetical protein